MVFLLTDSLGLVDDIVKKLEKLKDTNGFSDTNSDKHLDKLKEDEKEVCRALLMKERRNQEKWAKIEKEENDKQEEEYQRRREERELESERRREERRRQRDKEREREKEKERERRKRREELQVGF